MRLRKVSKYIVGTLYIPQAYPKGLLIMIVIKISGICAANAFV